MNRIEMDLTTGIQRTVELTAEEIAQAQANYAKWELDEAQRKAELEITIQEQIAKLQAQLAEIQ